MPEFNLGMRKFFSLNAKNRAVRLDRDKGRGGDQGAIRVCSVSATIGVGRFSTAAATILSPLSGGKTPSATVVQDSRAMTGRHRFVGGGLVSAKAPNGRRSSAGTL